MNDSRLEILTYMLNPFFGIINFIGSCEDNSCDNMTQYCDSEDNTTATCVGM